MPRSKSSKRWLQEHFSDFYVLKAQKEGYRSRAVYKLQEIDLKEKLLKPGMTAVGRKMWLKKLAVPKIKIINAESLLWTVCPWMPCLALS